jgi:hypothetical protein
VSDEREQRRARLDTRLHAQRGRRSRPEIVADVERLTGSRPDLDEFLSAVAAGHLARLYLAAASDPSAQRQTWSRLLVHELRTTMASLAAELEGVETWWLHRLSETAGAVRVDAAALLRNTEFSERDYDLVVLTADADDGLRVAYDHLPDRDEFELILWGRLRRE